MSEFIPQQAFITKQSNERMEKRRDTLLLSPWIVQQLIYEILQDFMVTNDPAELGYTFEHKYNVDHTQSDIALQIAYDYKAATASKRPGVFIYRNEAGITYPTIGGAIGHRFQDSQTQKLAMVKIPIVVNIVASPLGFAEQLAEYIKQPLMYYAQILQKDFGFEQFRLVSVGKPEVLKEAEDNFSIQLGINVAYSDGWVITGDHLKLKTFSAQIFDNVRKKPLENQ